MNIKKMTIATTAIIITSITFGVTAQPGNNANENQSGRSQHNNKPGMHDSGEDRMQDMDNTRRGQDNDRDKGNLKGNENSNRQSDPGSTRGIDRAAERHSEKSKNAARQSQADKDSHWYDFMFGKNKKVKNDSEGISETSGKKQRWWWPFD